MTLDLLAVVKQAVREVLQEEGFNAPTVVEEPSGYLQLSHAAKYADVSTSTIKEWRRLGLKVHRQGKVRLVERAELRRYIERHLSPVAEATPEERAAKVLSTMGRKR